MLNNIKKVFYNIKNFGVIFGLKFFLSKTIFRKKEWKFRLKSINLLDKNLNIDYTKYKKAQYIFNYEETKKIFVFWWDGFKNAPFQVKKNLSYLLHNFKDYKIIKIDKTNFNKFVSLNQCIMNLFYSKRISIQTFSDILRFNLLYNYGGFWFDATIRCYKYEDFAKMLQYNEIYSLNVDCKEKRMLRENVVPNMKYTTFFIGTRKNSTIMKFLVDAYNAYYNKYDYCIDYFMNDYFLALAERNHIAENALNNIPPHEGNPFYAFNCISTNQKILLSECEKCPQKLNWRYAKLDNLF